MTDKSFLVWLKERLQHVHGENPNVDYMHRLQRIIDSIPESEGEDLLQAELVQKHGILGPQWVSY